MRCPHDHVPLRSCAEWTASKLWPPWFVLTPAQSTAANAFGRTWSAASCLRLRSTGGKFFSRLQRSLWHFGRFVTDELINALAVNVFQQLSEVAHIHKRATDRAVSEMIQFFLSHAVCITVRPSSLSSDCPSVIVRIEGVSQAIHHLAVLGNGQIDTGTTRSVGQLDRLRHRIWIFAAMIHRLEAKPVPSI
jgi:hypothetical protein